MVCSECGSETVNKSTCPLVLKNPKPEHWSKHPKAKKPKLVVKPKPRPPITHTPKFTVKPKPVISPHLKFNIKRKPPIKTYKNPYSDMARKLCENTVSMKKIKLSGGKIIITGEQLSGLRVNVKNPSKLILKLNNTKSFINKLGEYMNLFCDIYKRLGSLVVTNQQFFVRPNAETKNILDMIPSITAIFIDFLVKNIYPSGGSSSKIDINMPIEDILLAEEIKQDELRLSILEIESLPAPPTSLPPIGQKTGPQKERVILKN